LEGPPIMLMEKQFHTNEKKILFIDDEEAQRDVMERVLDRMGYAVTISNSSEHALEILEKETFPLIITDLSMPGMDGTTFCKEVRQTNTESVIYALSGYIESYKADKLEALGFDGFLRKPATIEMLRQAIEGAFDKMDR
jgi:CheY-like chemotaxis protein